MNNLINYSASAEMMMSKNTGNNVGDVDPLIEYIINESSQQKEDKKVVCLFTCQHTRDYTVKMYYGILCNKDDNYPLFIKSMSSISTTGGGSGTSTNRTKDEIYENYFNYSNNYAVGFTDGIEQKCDTVVLLDNSSVEVYYTYTVKILFKNNKPLFGEINFIRIFTPNVSRVNIKYTNESDSLIKDVVCYYTKRYIPKLPNITNINQDGDGCISNVKYKIFLRKATKSEYVYDSEGNQLYDDDKTSFKKVMATYISDIYDNNGKNYYKYAFYDMNNNYLQNSITGYEIPCEVVTYGLKWEQIEIGEGDEKTVIDNMTKEPKVIETSRIVDRSYSDYTTYMDTTSKLPRPNIYGELTFKDIGDIYYDYESQLLSESMLIEQYQTVIDVCPTWSTTIQEHASNSYRIPIIPTGDIIDEYNKSH